MEPGAGRQAFAEFLGVMLFILFASGVVAATAVFVTTDPGMALLIRSLGTGLALGTLVTVFMPISGGHLNPAVTFASSSPAGFGRRRRPSTSSPSSSGASPGRCFVAAFLPGYLALLEFGPPDLAPVISGPANIGQGIFIELVLTFVLVLVVFATAVDPRAPRRGTGACGSDWRSSSAGSLPAT